MKLCKTELFCNKTAELDCIYTTKNPVQWNTKNKQVEYYEKTSKLRNNIHFRYYARNGTMFYRVTNNSF